MSLTVERIVSQMKTRLQDLEHRSNGSAWHPSSKTSGYAVAEIPDWQLRQWISALSGEEEPQAARNSEGGEWYPNGESREDYNMRVHGLSEDDIP